MVQGIPGVRPLRVIRKHAEYARGTPRPGKNIISPMDHLMDDDNGRNVIQSKKIRCVFLTSVEKYN
jgi:hypothetical protein